MLQKTPVADRRARSRDDFSIAIAALPANARQRKIAFLAFIILVVIVGANIPFAHMQLGHIHYFVPAIQTAVCIANLLTAIFLFAQYSIYPQRALLALAGGFVFSGLFALLQMLAYPTVLSSAGLIGDEFNSGPWLFTFWQTALSLAVIVYALSRDAGEPAKRSSRSVAIDIAATSAGVVIVTIGLTWVATAGVGYLPPLHQNELRRTDFAMGVSAFLALLNVTGLMVLFVHRRTLLDQWLLVTLAAWLPNLVMASFLSGMRYSEVWYVSRVYALFAGSALLFALLSEMVGLHTRLTNAIVRLRRTERVERRLAAIVESSDDAIISEDLNGVITTWNRGAERLIGYSAAEATGKSITMLFPPGSPNEEIEILRRICQGERIDRHVTTRRRKDGSMFDVALSVSPLFDESGTIIGASKIVRDITERRRFEDHQRLLVGELDHRVKNILAQVAVVATSTRQGNRSIDEFLRSLDGRLQSMAAAHALLSENSWQNVGLDALVRKQLAPYATGSNVTISGTDVLLNAAETQAVARVLHELATNAAKYGALSIPEGQVSVNWEPKPNGAKTSLILVWRELNGPPVVSEHRSGYGTNLIRNLIPHELGGTVNLVLAKEGVNCRIDIPSRRA